MNQQGVSHSIVIRLSASTLAVVVLLGLTWFCAAVSADRLRASYAHTVNTIDALSGAVLQGTKLRDDEETGLRGYLLTGQPRFLQPYDAAQRALPAQRTRQDLLADVEPAVLPLARAERRAGDAWGRWATDILAHPAPAPRGAAALVAQQDQGKALFDRYRAAADRVITHLDAARQEDLRASVATSVMTDRLFAAFFASAIVLGLLLGWQALRAVTRPLTALRRAAEAIGHGDLTQPVAIAGAGEFVRLGAEMDAMRRQLQARADELVASEARFRALAEHGSDLVCVLAPDGAALYGSPSYTRVLGASLEDLHRIAGGPLAAIHPDDRAHVHAALAACVKEGRPSAALTCRHRHADGSWRTLECVATNRLADSAVRGVIVTSRDVTARVEAEERLRASEDRLRTIITHLPVILFALDADGVFTLSDGAGLAPLGVAQGAVVGRSAFDIHADHPAITAGFRRAFAGEPADFIHTVDGFTLDVRVTPLRDAQGHVTGVIGVSVDVTERVRAEEALRAEEEALRAEEARYRAVAAAAHDAIIAADSAGRIISWNRGAEAIFGYTVDEAIGQPLTILMPEEYRAAHRSGLERLARGEASHALGSTLDLQGRRKDGSAFPIELSLSSWETAEGVYYGGIIRDVSARRAMEAALDQERTTVRASEERLRTVVANAPLILFTLDPDGVYTMSDGAGLAALGREPGAVVGRSVFDVYQDQPALLDDTRRALAGTPVTFPSHVHGAVFDNHLTPLHDAQGRLISVIGVSTDITERAHAEAALAENRRELERSNAELQQFAYVASHDLQEPLRTITSYLTLLQRRYGGQLGPDADEFIGFATDGAQRMSALIKAVLAYSRVGTHGAAFGPTDCGALVTTAVANLEARIVERGARVVCDATLPTVQGDAAQLGQLFQNLLGNALTFTRPDTPPVVRVAAERQGARWLVRVVDNGIGIAPAHSARIFQMFGRLHTRTEYAGTGIGLAVCQRIVERHGGRIWVESTPGQGATFLFTLPAAAAEGALPAAADGREDAASDGREDAAA